jgi:hypothetical protein
MGSTWDRYPLLVQRHPDISWVRGQVVLGAAFSDDVVTGKETAAA